MPEDEKLEIWKRQYQREKQARKEAEDLLETKSRELYLANEELKSLTKELEERVAERTKTIKKQRNEALLQAAQLRESEKRFQDVTEAAGEYVWETDENLVITYLSEQARVSLEYEIEDLVGFPLASIFDSQTDDDQANINNLIEHFHKRETFRGQVLRCRDKFGNPKWHSISAVPKFNDSKAFKGFRGTGRDISDIQKARDEAIKAARAKSEFFSNMSHEIRTPLNGIVGMSQILLESNLREDQFGYANSIKSSADSLISLVNAIFDISMIEAGNLYLKEEDVSIDELLDSCIDYMMPKASPKGLRLELSIHPEVPQYITSDGTRLRQALLNLLDNAIKFTICGEVSLAVEATPDGLCFQISDTGVGINESTIDTLFQSYEANHSLSYQREGGSGLGLSICKGIAEAMGGKLTASSQPRKGSVFRFLIPIQVPKLQTRTFPDKRCIIFSDPIEPAKQLAERLKRFGCQTQLTVKPLTLEEPEIQFEDLILFRFLDATRGQELEQIKACENSLLEKGAKVVHICSTEDFQQVVGIRYIEYPLRSYRLLRILSPVDAVPTQVAKPLQGCRSLVVDDNKINLQVAHSMLSNLGMLVETCSAASVGIEALKRSSFDVILMDIRMPGINGVEASRIIRSRGIDTPIIAVTANAGEGELDVFKEAGMNGYVPKPLLSSSLEKEILRCLNREAPPSASTTKVDDEQPHSIFDANQLLTLFSNNIDLAKMVVSEFLKQTEILLEELGILLDRHNYAAARECLHNLSGSSYNLRAMRFGQSCAALGSVLTANATPDDISEQLQEIRHSHETLRSQLEQFLSSETPSNKKVTQ